MASNVIKLVRGDSGPDVKVTLTDETTGQPVNITGAVASLHFRELDGTTLMFTLTGTIVDGSTGEIIFEWGDGTLDIPEGDYEAEVEVVFQDGMRQTAYQLLYFLLRKDFA